MKITMSGGACLSGLPPDAMLSVFLCLTGSYYRTLILGENSGKKCV